LTTRRFEVLLAEVPVGHLDEAADGSKSFRFHDSYRGLARRPVLGQRFEDDLGRTYRGRRGRFPAFFANLLPEGKLREVIRKMARIEADDDLALLEFVGADLPGAVVLRASEAHAQVSDDAPAVPEGSGAAASEAGEDGGQADRFRFSVAGVQMKFSMLRDDDKLTLPATGKVGEWIVKFDSPTWQNLPKNEYSMLEWARAAGFDVPECHLYDASQLEGIPRGYARAGSQVLAVRRYDRNQQRIHQEDFAQVVGLQPDKKYDGMTYEAMAQLVRGVIGEQGADELVRRLVLMVACGNSDAHLKNWSLIYPDGVRAAWAPVYDQVSIVAWEDPDLDQRLSLKLAGVKDFGLVDRAAFVRLAEKAGLAPDRVTGIVDQTLSDLLDAWTRIQDDLPLPGAHVTALRRHWTRVPVLREAGILG
jgi:serine/threonine-protein kinase HipA